MNSRLPPRDCRKINLIPLDVSTRGDHPQRQRRPLLTLDTGVGWLIGHQNQFKRSRASMEMHSLKSTFEAPIRSDVGDWVDGCATNSAVRGERPIWKERRQPSTCHGVTLRRSRLCTESQHGARRILFGAFGLFYKHMPKPGHSALPAWTHRLGNVLTEMRQP